MFRSIIVSINNLVIQTIVGKIRIQGIKISLRTSLVLKNNNLCKISLNFSKLFDFSQIKYGNYLIIKWWIVERIILACNINCRLHTWNTPGIHTICEPTDLLGPGRFIISKLSPFTFVPLWSLLSFIFTLLSQTSSSSPLNRISNIFFSFSSSYLFTFSPFLSLSFPTFSTFPLSIFFVKPTSPAFSRSCSPFYSLISL